MPAVTFDQLKKKLDAACESLRGFTLGRDGFTQRDGRNGIKLVEDLIDKFSKLPQSQLAEHRAPFAKRPNSANPCTAKRPFSIWENREATHAR